MIQFLDLRDRPYFYFHKDMIAHLPPSAFAFSVSENGEQLFSFYDVLLFFSFGDWPFIFYDDI